MCGGGMPYPGGGAMPGGGIIMPGNPGGGIIMPGMPGGGGNMPGKPGGGIIIPGRRLCGGYPGGDGGQNAPPGTAGTMRGSAGPCDILLQGGKAFCSYHKKDDTPPDFNLRACPHA